MKNRLQFIGIDALNEWAKNNTQYLKDGKIEVSLYQLQNFNENKNGRYKSLEIPGYSCAVMVIVVFAYTQRNMDTKQDDFQYYYVENTFIGISINDTVLVPYGVHNDKTFSFHLLDEIRHNYVHNLSSYDKKEFPEPPKKVGKATQKSLQAWIDYLQEIEKLKQQIIDEKTQKVNAFLGSLQPYESSIKWYNNHSQGRIERGGLLYEFSIDNTGYVSQKWEKHYSSPNDLTTFMAVSDNKLL